MVRRGNKATLYELMKTPESRARPQEPHPDSVDSQRSAGDSSRDEAGPKRWLEAGRAVRLPVGYFFVGAAMVLALLILVYIVAFDRGGDAWRRDNAAVGLENRRIAEEITNEGNGSEAMRGDDRTGRAPPADGGIPADPAFGPLFVNPANEPRRAGLNYIYLITTSRSGAQRVAEFCRERGVDARIEQVNNANFRVFVLPGYTREDRNSSGLERFRRRIEEIRLEWKVREGKDELRSTYAEKYSGS